MNKQNTKNIQRYIRVKLQRAENYIDNNAPELALDLLADIEKDINKGVRYGLLPNDYKGEAERLVKLRDKADNLIKMDKETTSRLNRNERRE